LAQSFTPKSVSAAGRGKSRTLFEDGDSGSLQHTSHRLFQS
jgi:hypothetical protein